TMCSCPRGWRGPADYQFGPWLFRMHAWGHWQPDAVHCRNRMARHGQDPRGCKSAYRTGVVIQRACTAHRMPLDPKRKEQLQEQDESLTQKIGKAHVRMTSGEGETVRPIHQRVGQPSREMG